MTAKQYTVLLEFYNEWNSEFCRLSDKTQSAFFDILYNRTKPTDRSMHV